MDHELVAIDEASFQLATSYKRIWFPKGEKPKGAKSGKFTLNGRHPVWSSINASHGYWRDVKLKSRYNFLIDL